MGRLFTGLLVLVGLLTLVAIGGYFVLKRPDIPFETLAARYETSASRYVDLPSGVRMHYNDEGNQSGPPLVLLHGFAVSMETWDAWVEQLGAANRIITLDLPGHGLTRAPAGYRASMEAYRDDVAAFVDALELSRFALAGNSMGGNVAWEYALAHPERVDALILVDAAGWPPTGTDMERDPPVFKLLRSPAAPLLATLDNTALVRNGLEASFFDKTLVTDNMVARHAEWTRAPGHRDLLLQMTLAFQNRNWATAERLGAITTPTLILHGAQDAIIPAAHAQLFADAIPGSELVVMENMGHLPQVERPEESVALVSAFLARVRAEQTPALAAQ